ncbi:hypothetical protein HYV89_00205 [Candidatus Woesearchaeota archaeon]|nr:hypothetical protein [Candidatus Woesearchaeota archaeon]
MARKTMKKSKSISSVKKALNTGFLLSVGIASIAKENAEKIARELVRKGRLNEKEGRKLVSDLIKKSKKEKDRMKRLLMG